MNFQLLTDITTKGGSFSFNFDLVGDGNNLTQLQDIIDPSIWFDSSNSSEISSNIFYNKTLPAGISIKDMPFIYGQLILQQGYNDNGNKYITCYFTNELRSFADEIGDKLIIGNDLDNNGVQSYDINFSEYNHYFNWNNILASQNITSTNITIQGNQSYGFPNFYKNSKGFYYGFIDLDGPNSINLRETNKALIQNFRPTIYAAELWKKIWDRTSYNCVSNFTGSTTFQSLVIPMVFDKTSQDSRNINGSADEEFNVGLKNNFSGLTLTIAGGQYLGPTTINSTLPFNKLTGSTTYETLFCNKGVSYNSNLCSNPLLTTCMQPDWVVTTSGSYDVEVKLGFNINLSSLYSSDHFNYININVHCYIYLLRNNKVICLSKETFVYSNTGGGTNSFDLPMGPMFQTDADLLTSIEGYEFWAGDKIFTRVGFYAFNSPATHGYTMTLDVKSDTSYFYNKYNQKNFYEYGQIVNMQKCLPQSYNQMDFITDII